MTARLILTLATIGVLGTACDATYDIGVPEDRPGFGADVDVCTLDIVDGCKPDKPGGLKAR